MRKFLLVMLSLAFVAATQTSTAEAQAAQTPTWEGALGQQWKSLHNKILAMAKDSLFPDSKLGTKPHPDSRTVLDEYRHVTIGLEMSTAQLKGEKFDYMARVKADESKPASRADVIREMEAAIAASYPVVESKANPRLLFWIEHQAEHYGKLVSNYRLAGVVPPVSRRQ